MSVFSLHAQQTNKLIFKKKKIYLHYALKKFRTHVDNFFGSEIKTYFSLFVVVVQIRDFEDTFLK